MVNFAVQRNLISLLVTLLLCTIVIGCGGGGSGSSSGNPTGGTIPTVTYNLTYSANTASTNLYINGTKVSDGSSVAKIYNSGTIISLTFDDTYTFGTDQYVADTYTIDGGPTQAIQPGGISLTMDKNHIAKINYTKIPGGP